MNACSNSKPLQRFTHGVTCPVCGGSEDDPRVQAHAVLGFALARWVIALAKSSPKDANFMSDPARTGTGSRGNAAAGSSTVPPIPASPAGARPLALGPSSSTSTSIAMRRAPCCSRSCGSRTARLSPAPARSEAALESRGRAQGALQPAGRRDCRSRSAGLGRGGREGRRPAGVARPAGHVQPGGAGKWLDEFSQSLAGRHCRIIADNDNVGREHARKVARSLAGKAASVKIVDLPGLPQKGDVSDFLNQGGNIELLDNKAPARQRRHKVLGGFGGFLSPGASNSPWTCDRSRSSTNGCFPNPSGRGSRTSPSGPAVRSTCRRSRRS